MDDAADANWTPDAAPDGSPLTAREAEILRLAADGGQTATISASLWLSPSTVKTHFENIYTKLRAVDRTHAVATALRNGWID